MSTSSLRRQMKNIVHNFSEAEIKVREATSNDPWGPSSSLMSDISDLTYNVVAFSEIMSMVWKRLNDHGKNWRHVYKALMLLDYMVKTGSDRVAQQCRENIYVIQTLMDFQYIDKDGKDQGLNVREKAKHLVTLLKDEDKLQEERTLALKTKEKMAQTTNIGSSTPTLGLGRGRSGGELLEGGLSLLSSLTKNSGGGLKTDQEWKKNTDEEDVQMKARSKEEVEQPSLTEQGAVDPWVEAGSTTAPPTSCDPWGGDGNLSAPPNTSDPWGGDGNLSAPSNISDPWGGDENTTAPPSTADPWGGNGASNAPSASSDPWQDGGMSTAAPNTSDPWGGNGTSNPLSASSDPWKDDGMSTAAPTSSDPWGGNVTSTSPPVTCDPWGGNNTSTSSPAASDPWGGDGTTPALPPSNDPWESTSDMDLSKTSATDMQGGDKAQGSAPFDMSPLGTALPTNKTPESFLGPNAALVDLSSLSSEQKSKQSSPPSSSTSSVANPIMQPQSKEG
ncbi:epsin-1-like [Scleropages formosus]|uniref:epsin-1-like n=1 Tax=Scleropages formosus TaxID=113540 RepID=UPI00087851FA|nr:epsin-1-like [Scleropages formosus]XP_018594882.1 epsin-1-like [Scleropages formosus]XP_018594883.1 epsin-1-like [Scleropages formosus]